MIKQATFDVDITEDNVYDNTEFGYIGDAAKRAIAAGKELLLFNGRYYLPNGGNPIDTGIKESDVNRSKLTLVLDVPTDHINVIEGAILRLINDATGAYPLQSVRINSVTSEKVVQR